MDNNFRIKQRRGYNTIQRIRSITMAVILLSMSIIMFAADKLKLEQIAEMDCTLRYLFGFVCLLYGVFRLYRGIKNEEL